ncbi:hypothetical protein EI94DRAFT_1784363, partial [Lactarius quietus]
PVWSYEAHIFILTSGSLLSHFLTYTSLGQLHAKVTASHRLKISRSIALRSNSSYSLTYDYSIYPSQFSALC